MHIALGNLPCDTEICITSLLQLSKMMLLSLFPCVDYLFKCSVPPLPKGCNYPYRLNLLTWGGEVVQTRFWCGGSVNQTFCPFITSFTRSLTWESKETLVVWVGKWLKPGSKKTVPVPWSAWSLTTVPPKISDLPPSVLEVPVRKECPLDVIGSL